MWGRGSVLGGRYTLTERIGGGGMGDVWRADDEVLQRQVAVKVLHPALLADELFAERFRREARLLAALSHPGIVDVHDYGESDPGSGEQLAFIVMELIDGQPLHEVLAESGTMPAERALDLVAQVLDALHAAHQRDIVHRDLKPANLMLRGGDRVTVTDFGIARDTASTKITASHSVLGTALYMAPEQAEGAATTPASDLYSVGVVCYELLTGQPPFTGDMVLEIVLKHIREPVPELPGLFPRTVRDFVATALAKQPVDRYPDAATMAAAARAALRGGGPPTVAATAPAPVVVPVADEARTVVEPQRAVEPRRRRSRFVVPLVIPIVITGSAGTALLIDQGAWQTNASGPSASTSGSANAGTPSESSASSPSPVASSPAAATSASTNGTATASRSAGATPKSTVPGATPKSTVPGATATVTAPASTTPTAARTTSPPAATTPPAVTVPQGCGGSGWGYITGVASNVKLGLAADSPAPGTAVIMGGQTAHGWVRSGPNPGGWYGFHPCNLDKPALAADNGKVQLSSGFALLTNWTVTGASTPGTYLLKMDQSCLTDNGAGNPVTTVTCTPGNKFQEWRLPTAG